MKKISVTLYNYNELPEKTQQKIVDKQREINIEENAYWWQNTWENYRPRIEQLFEVRDMYFQYTCSQGDGAMFEYDDIRRPLVVAAINSLKNITDRERKVLLAHLFVYGHGKHSGRHYHEASCNHLIELQWNEQTAEQSDRQENLLQLLNKVWSPMEEYFIKIYEQLSKRLFCLLQEESHHLTSDSQVISNLIKSDKLFLSNGEVAPSILHEL